jgi:hypothetical protein
MKLHACLCALALSLLLPGCDESDAVAVRIQLRPDFSGTLTASALERPAEGARAPLEARGVTWKSRVDLHCATGDFARLAELGISDATLTAGEGEGGLCFLRLSLPRGPGIHWAHELVPLDAAERKSASSAFDPTGQVTEIGATVKFEVTLPSSVVGNGVTPRPRGTKFKGDGNIATLTVPVETALAQGEPIVWHLTWQK